MHPLIAGVLVFSAAAILALFMGRPHKDIDRDRLRSAYQDYLEALKGRGFDHIDGRPANPVRDLADYLDRRSNAPPRV